MRFDQNQTVQLGGTRYLIRQYLGGGALAEAFLATPVELPETEVVIKVIGETKSQDSLTVQGFRREAEALGILNQAEDPQWPRHASLAVRLKRAELTTPQRRVIALLDSGDDVSGQPFLVQEKAPPAFERFSVASWADEQQALAVALAVAEVIVLAHQHNLALTDFEPNTKWDRIRLHRLDADHFELKIIDWNVTGDSRDFANDLLYFGGHLYYFLLGRRVALDKDKEGQVQPPSGLALDGPGQVKLTTGSSLLLKRLLQRDPKRRYQDAAQVRDDLAWWLNTLRQAKDPNATERLQDRLWQARSQARHDRVIAVASLSLLLDLAPEGRQAMELWRRQAQEELEKEDWRPIAHARSTLLTGAYEKAVTEFRQQILALSPDSPTARLARIFKALAEAGEQLRRENQDADVRATPVWEALNRASSALVDRRWTEAQDVLIHDVSRSLPGIERWLGVMQLIDLAAAGVASQEAADLIAGAEMRPPDADTPTWIELEGEKIKQQQKGVELLRTAQTLAKAEPEFESRLQAEETRLKTRRQLFLRYQDAEKDIETGRVAFEQGRQTEAAFDLQSSAVEYGRAASSLQRAVEQLQAILVQDPAQPRARLLMQRWNPKFEEARTRAQAIAERAKKNADTDAALGEAKNLLFIGRYEEALKSANLAVTLSPNHRDAQELRSTAEAGSRLHARAQGIQATARQYFQARNLTKAKEETESVYGWHGQPMLSLLGTQTEGSGLYRGAFVLADDSRLQARILLDVIPRVEDKLGQIKDARDRFDHKAVIRYVDELEKAVKDIGGLTDDEKSWRQDAHRRQSAIEGSVSKLTSTPGFAELRGLMDELSGDQSPRAAELRAEAGEQWRRNIKQCSDLDAARKLIIEGIQLFPSVTQGAKASSVWDQMQDLVDVGIAVDKRLAVLPGESEPAWFRELDKDRLKQLEDDLSKLGASPNWRKLQIFSRDRRGQTVEFLANVLQPKLEAAQQDSRNRYFQTARADATSVWSSVPDTLQKQLPSTIQAGFTELIASLNDRIDADARCETALGQLATSQQRFVEAHKFVAAKSLPEHSDVPVDDLEARIADFKLAASMEQGAQTKLSTLENNAAVNVKDYVTFIKDRTEDAKRSLPKLDAIGQLTSRIQGLRKSLTDSANGARKDLCDALKQSVDALEAQPITDPMLLLILHQQAVWLHIWAGDDIPESGRVGALPNELLDAAIAKLSGTKRHGDLEDARRIVVHAQQLNDGLTLKPGVPGHVAPVNLPLLPLDRKDYKAPERALDRDMLADVAKELEFLLKWGPSNPVTNAAEEESGTLETPGQMLPSSEQDNGSEDQSSETTVGLLLEPQATQPALESATVSGGADSIEPGLAALQNGTLSGTNAPERSDQSRNTRSGLLGRLRDFMGVSAARKPNQVSQPPTELIAAPAHPRSAEPGEEQPDTASPDIYAPVRLDATKDKLTGLLDSLGRLKDVLGKLGHGPWGRDTSPGQWEDEASLLSNMAKALEAASRPLQAAPSERDAIAGLGILHDQITKEQLEELKTSSLWLLAPQRTALQVAFSALRRDLKSSISTQVAVILEDRGTAPDTLQNKIFRRVSAKEIADTVHDAVLAGVEQRAKSAQEAGQADQARSLWKIVMEATKPWVSFAPRASDIAQRDKPLDATKRERSEKAVSHAPVSKPPSRKSQEHAQATVADKEEPK